MERSTETRLQIGDTAPYFSLRATDGRIYSISDFTGTNALAVIFTANHCPYAQAYEARLCSLAEEFASQGVRFVAICSNDGESYPEDNYENMVERSTTLRFPYPYLHDESQTVARAYDAACTPEAYLFDSNLKLRYQGLIDDNYLEPDRVRSPYLRNAILALLSGKVPPVQRSNAIGCSIKWKR